MSADTIHLLGDEIRVLAGTGDTAGEVTVIEVTTQPGGGPPLHTHPQTEVFVVTDGELELELDGETVTLGRGKAVTAPGGTPHTYRNASSRAATFIVAITPAGMERFFGELAAATADGPPDMAVVTDISARHGITFVAAGAPA